MSISTTLLILLTVRVTGGPARQGWSGRAVRPRTVTGQNVGMKHAPAPLVAGPRMTLRRRRRDDSESMHRLVVEAAAHLRPWMPWAGDRYDLAAAEANGVHCDEAWEHGAAFAYVVEVGGVAVGTCELRRRDGGVAEIGYWLHPAHTGAGLATEAARLLVEQAFALPDVAAVEIWHDAANTASSGVPRRLGFTEIDRRTPPREPLTPGEAGVDVVWRRERPQR